MTNVRLWAIAICVAASAATATAQSPQAPTTTPPHGAPNGPANGAGGLGDVDTNPDDRGASAPGLAQFGAWLDDASVAARGSGRVTIGAGYWRTDNGGHANVPVVEAAYSLLDGVQIAAFVPFYRASSGGVSAAGIDDVYLSAKVALVNGATAGRRFGVAVSPAVEILGTNTASDRRLHWALPVSVEARATRLRVMASGGYFSRGAAFGGAAIEWTALSTTAFWFALTDSYSIETGTDLAPPARDRHRLDVAAGVARSLTDALSAYASIGRTLTGVSGGGASLGVTAGISFHFSRSLQLP